MKGAIDSAKSQESDNIEKQEGFRRKALLALKGMYTSASEEGGEGVPSRGYLLGGAEEAKHRDGKFQGIFGG